MSWLLGKVTGLFAPSATKPESTAAGDTKPAPTARKEPFVAPKDLVPQFSAGTVAIQTKPCVLKKMVTGQWEIQAYGAIAGLVKTAPFEYVLEVFVDMPSQPAIRQRIHASINPEFSKDDSSFRWAMLLDSQIYAWALQLEASDFAGLKAYIAIACMEASRREDFTKIVSEEDKPDVLGAYDSAMDTKDDYDELSDFEEVARPKHMFTESKRDTDDAEEEDEEEEDEEPAPKSSIRTGAPMGSRTPGKTLITSKPTPSKSAKKATRKSGAGGSSELAVGMATNRSYVVRGNKMGVFKHNEDDETELIAQMASLKMKSGDILSPTKIMLYGGENKMLMLNEKKPDTVFALDIERQKIVEEWTTQNEMVIGNIAPTEKYAQRTTEQNIVGVNSNAVFRMDPRQAKAPVVQQQSYQKAYQLSTLNTNGAGHIAVGSAKGEIRLYTDCDKRCKTLLPGLGDAIVDVDVTEDGHFILATTAHYLLVLPTAFEEEKRGSVVVRTGFEARMGKNKQKPVKLFIKPADMAKYNMAETSFSGGKFNTGEGIKEASIVSSTGPFVVIWDFAKAKQGKNVYKIKAMSEDVVSDQFVFNRDDKLVITTEDDIYLQSRKK